MADPPRRTITLRLSDSELAVLERAAAVEGCTRSEWLRRVIDRLAAAEAAVPSSAPTPAPAAAKPAQAPAGAAQRMSTAERRRAKAAKPARQRWNGYAWVAE